jgi:hypothetical protein
VKIAYQSFNWLAQASLIGATSRFFGADVVLSRELSWPAGVVPAMAPPADRRTGIQPQFAAIFRTPNGAQQLDVRYLAEQKIVPRSRKQAHSLTPIVGNGRLSQVVDIRKGGHCMIPKSIFTSM